jgi:dephospho-CoA kinase
MAEERGGEPTRANLHRLSRQAMAEHGQGFFMQSLIDEIEAHDWPAVVISGAHTPADVETLRARFGRDVLVVHVAVGDPMERYRRMQTRDAPRDPETYEGFLRQEREEEEMFSVGEAICRADLTIENNTTLEAFHQRIEETIIRPVLVDEVG